MRNRTFLLTILAAILLIACNSENMRDFDDAYSKSEGLYSGSDGGGSGTPNGNGNNNNQYVPGLITAGEWNDLDSWSFWQNLLTKDEFKGMPAYWSIFTNNRISVKISTTGGQPAIDAKVELKRNNTTIFSAKTDNQGKAELWTDLYQQRGLPDFSTLEIVVNEGAAQIKSVKSFNEGVNEAVIAVAETPNKIEISFVVDATGSMGDELEYLKAELLDVITKAKAANPKASFLTSSVFYRDVGDEYLTRISNFTNDINVTLNFIKNQRADGGGDYPEAVHTALEKTVNELQWSSQSRARLVFLVLDAPPHHRNDVITSIQSSLEKFAAKGIKIIPITASGIDKETEFLMRFFAMTTNGTYVFVTNDSGIGNDHIEASVGEYQVEFLNELMLRLINKYSE